MAIRFIRQPSETPNVANTDDARMIRYAYGNQNGYVKNAGKELSYTVIDNIFKINSGVVVLQGWESELDSNGWTIIIDNVTTKKYYSIYYEVNLANQTTSIKSVYDTAGYPEIDSGDDLTAVQTGTARFLLYQFTTINGVISDISKIVSEIHEFKTFVEQIVEEIMGRVEEGQVSTRSVSLWNKFEFLENSLKKRGKTVTFNAKIRVYPKQISNGMQEYLELTVPDGFKPINSEDTPIMVSTSRENPEQQTTAKIIGTANYAYQYYQIQIARIYMQGEQENIVTLSNIVWETE